MVATSGGFVQGFTRVVHVLFWWWWSVPHPGWVRWVMRCCGVIGTIAAAAMVWMSEPKRAGLPMPPEREEGVRVGSIALYLLLGVLAAPAIAAVLILSPFFGALVVIALVLTPVLDDEVRGRLARRLHVGRRPN